MKGLPGTIKTRADIEHLKSYLGTPYDTPESRAAILAQLKAIRATAQHYVFSRMLASIDARAGDEPAYRVLQNQGESGNEIHEFQLVDQPHSRLIDIGMSADELDQLILELSA